MRTDKASAVLAIIAAVAMAALWFTDGDDGTTQNYCEMREIWEESGGRYGWPAFSETKEKECKL